MRAATVLVFFRTLWPRTLQGFECSALCFRGNLASTAKDGIPPEGHRVGLCDAPGQLPNELGRWDSLNDALIDDLCDALIDALCDALCEALIDVLERSQKEFDDRSMCATERR